MANEVIRQSGIITTKVQAASKVEAEAKARALLDDGSPLDYPAFERRVNNCT